MKGKLKKLAAMIMAATMTFGMASTVFADDTTTGSQNTAKLTVEKSKTDDEGNTVSNEYTAYQVMTAKANETGTAGSFVYTYTVTENFKNFFGNKTYGNYTLNNDGEIVNATEDPTIIASDGTAVNTNTTAASRLASALEQYALDNGIVGTTLPATMAIGYYVVAETVSNIPVASKPILVDLRGDVTVQPKDDEITLDKKIVEGEKLVEANNVSIGDTIEYQVTSQIPEYEANVDKNMLSYVLEDNFTGITYNKDVAVTLTIDETNITLVKDTDYTIEETDSSFKITFKQDTIYNYQGASVMLKYSGKLNASAKVDSTDGNPNKITLTYTNNPNQGNSFDTLEDDVTTYTYGFQIRKVDKNDYTKDMAGATFEIRDSEDNLIGSFKYGDDGSITNTKGVVTLNGNYATIKGVDAGTYTIVETKAPDGYSLLGSGVTVTITDEGEAAGTDPTGVAGVTVSSNASLEEANTPSTSTGTGASELKDNGDGSIDVVVKIENTKGISLPETGSTAMLICLAGGAAAIILGGLYFALSRRRRRA